MKTLKSPLIQALDSRMMQLTNNCIGLFLICIVGFWYCWQIGIGSIAVLVALVIIEVIVARKIQKNIAVFSIDENAGEVVAKGKWVLLTITLTNL
jgi:uncharacterized membrane protein